MAQAYPKSTFFGYDYHQASIEAARKRASGAGVADRVTFATASAAGFSSFRRASETPFNLVLEGRPQRGQRFGVASTVVIFAGPPGVGPASS